MLNASMSFIADDPAWKNVGVHPTPVELSERFSVSVASWIQANEAGRAAPARMVILDACSGDGRLGHGLAEALQCCGFEVSVTFVEIDVGAISRIKRTDDYPMQVVNANFFRVQFDGQFDIVVSNPPYRSIACGAAAEFGLTWSEVKRGSRNLYGVALARCIEMCKPRGYVAVIAPHGWLRNEMAGDLRQFVASSCLSLFVQAFTRRTLFPGVNQDTSFQLAIVDKQLRRLAPLNVSMCYDEEPARDVALSLGAANTRSAGDGLFRVRVGPFVWNREKELLQKSLGVGVHVVNGPNIQKDGSVNLSLPALKGRQYVRRTGLPANHLSTAPLIVVKRTMRGRPGNWLVDAALIVEKAFTCVAENHCIVIEPRMSKSNPALIEMFPAMAKRIQELHKVHGHPNVSVRLVRQAVSDLI